VLIPEPRRKWIIAKASAEDMKQIDEWIKRLDKEEPVESEYEIVQLRYADPEEVEDSVESGFRDLPGTEFLPSVMVEPLRETRQVMVFGRKDLREMVKKMIEQIDIPPGQFETRHFKLRHADPDEVKTHIDELFGEQSMTSGSRYTSIYYYGSSRSRGGGPQSANTVKVISYTSLKRVTVIASPENLEEIAKQIEEWDAPLDVNEVKPRIFELHNSDPVQMATLLRTLFSESSSGGFSIYDYIFGRMEEKQKIVGPLYGQLTFEPVPDTKKIIVISKISEAYTVVGELIQDLDRQEMAEVPKVVTLNYADPEDLAQRLNAMFNEPGTTATIRLSERGLSGTSMMGEAGGGGSSSGGGGGGASANQGANPGEYRPWWTTGRPALDEMPISNVIGRIRFIPDPHSKAILCLAPPEFIQDIEAVIKQLDVPGKQVIVQAIIMEVEHSSMTSLGLQLASDPTAFGTLEENAIMALNQLTYMSTRGPQPVTAERPLGVGVLGTGRGTVLGAGTDVFALIDFLVKTTNARILNQQTLWTKDNEQAQFFKGENVAFLAGSTAAAAVGVTQNVQFEDVGMELRVRPSITPERNVDMIANVNLSQLTSQLVNNQPVRSKMQTETNMIVEDGQTIMLAGILFQKDSTVRRKIPGLGDAPLIGGLFRHNETVQANNEMIVFITPYVIDEPTALPAEAKEELENIKRQEIESSRQKLESVREQLKSTLEELDLKD